MSTRTPIGARHAGMTDAFNIGKYLDVGLEGDWHKLPSLFGYLSSNSMGKGLKRDIAKAMRDFAMRYKRKLVAGLSTGGRAIGQAWSHAPGYSNRTGIVGVDTGNYLNALNNLRIKQNKYMMTLKFSKGDLNKRGAGKQTLGQYAMYFEYGHGKQPARPLWTATFQNIGGQRKMLQYITGAVGKRLHTLTT